MAEPLHRPDLFLVARLLENLDREGAPLRPTSLQLSSAINYTQLERYLDFLESRGLVALTPGDDGGPRIAITPRGHEALVYLAKAIREVLHEEFSRQA